MCKKLFLIFICFSMIFTSGCWDAIELNKRAFITTLTIDINDKAEEDQSNAGGKSFIYDEEAPQVLKVTFGIVNPNKIKSGEGAAIHRTVTASTLSDASEELNDKTSRVPFYGHIKLIIFTQKLIQNQKLFKEVIDKLQKSPNINQTAKVVVFNGTGDDFYEIKPKLEAVPAQYVSGILDNSRTSSSIVSMSLSQLLSYMRTWKGEGVIPYLEVEKAGQQEKRFEVNKIMLIKDYKLLQMLDTKYVKSYKIMNKELDVGRKFVNFDGVTVPFVIFDSKREINLVESNNKLKYNVVVNLEGDIEEVEFGRDIFDQEKISSFEDKIAKSMEEELQETTQYFKNQVGSDYLGFGEYTKKFKNKIYKKYEDNWDEAFKNAEINYKVKVDIRRVGASGE